MSRPTMEEHLRVDRYGDFFLTNAIRPGPRVPIVPRQGYRCDLYRDDRARLRVPVLAAAISREALFDCFLALVEPLGKVVDVVMETSHHGDGPCHRDLFREDIDLPVLMSHFCDFEDLLLNDGSTGVAVISTTQPIEVQFEEHKLLIVYARDLEPFTAIMRGMGIRRDDRLRLITEGEHLHSSDSRYAELFEQLCCRIGIAEPVEHVNG